MPEARLRDARRHRTAKQPAARRRDAVRRDRAPRVARADRGPRAERAAGTVPPDRGRQARAALAACEPRGDGAGRLAAPRGRRRMIALLKLYPREWRERYGAELEEIVA